MWLGKSGKVGTRRWANIHAKEECLAATSKWTFFSIWNIPCNLCPLPKCFSEQEKRECKDCVPEDKELIQRRLSHWDTDAGTTVLSTDFFFSEVDQLVSTREKSKSSWKSMTNRHKWTSVVTVGLPGKRKDAESIRKMKSRKKGKKKTRKKWKKRPLCLWQRKDNACVGCVASGFMAHSPTLMLIFFCINQKQLIKKEIFNSDMFFELVFHLVLFE